MRPADPSVTAIVRKAREERRSVSIGDDVFVPFLSRLLDSGELDPELATRNAADLLLACAASAGDAVAIAEIERTCVAPLDRAVGGIVRHHEVDEVKQRVRQLLFIASQERAPRIASYAGRGPLRAWVRACAVRTAMRVQRDSCADPPEAGLLLGMVQPDSEVSLLPSSVRERYLPAFRAALETALRSLEPRDRTILRQCFVDGVGTEDLARLHGVHRVTMFRRLGKLRRRVLKLTRRELAARVQGTRSELDSIMRFVRPRVELTLERVLASEG
jgi:RNA polymerase sigma-70 factor, ECF subfamily